jgi:HSP20 family molecular chaperone IbpA
MADEKEKAITKRDERNLSEIAKGAIVPPVDIYEEEEQVTLFADLPGVTRDDLNLQIDKDTLQIYGKTAKGAAADAATYYTEFPSRDFYRAFTIGEEIDREKISASMSNGVLKLVLPKAARAKPRKIEIKF